MSASRERKMRMEQTKSTAPAKKTKKKPSQGLILAICIVLIVAIVLGSVLIYRNAQTKKTVLTVGNHEVSVQEFNYFYGATANSIGSYASLTGIQTGVPLDEQNVTTSGITYLGLFGISTEYLTDKTPTDGTYDVTWAQLLAYNAMNTAAQTYAFYDEAMANGFTDDDIDTEINETIDSMRATAKTYGRSLDELLTANYGRGCNEKNYREYLRVSHIASHYASSLYENTTYTQEELDARYHESAEEFDVASFYLYKVSASDFVEEDAQGNTPDPTDAEKEKAKSAAEDMEKEFDTEKTGVTLRADNVRSTVQSNATKAAADWLFDEAKAEDVKLFASEDGNDYFVLKLVDKNDYQLINALQITIANDGEDGPAEGEKSAEEKVAAITAALKEDASEENFKALIEEYPTENSNGVSEGMSRNNLVNLSDEAFFWAGMETRKVGDYEMFKTDSSTVFLFFNGYGKSRQETVVTNTLINERLTALVEAAVAACNYDESAAMKANVDLTFRDTSSN